MASKSSSLNFAGVAGLALSAMLAAGCGAQGKPEANPPAPSANRMPAAAASVLPRGWLPENQRHVVDLVTLGSGLHAKAAAISSFIPGQEIGRITVEQELDPDTSFPTEIEIIAPDGTLVFSSDGSGDYQRDWNGLN